MKPAPPLLLAVDPGARGCGVALFHHGALVRAEYVAYKHTKEVMPKGAEAWVGMASMIPEWLDPWMREAEGCIPREPWEEIDVRPSGQAVILVEDMKVYAGSKSKGDPAALLHLAAVGGGVACLFASMGWTPESVSAATWNGQVSRDIRQARTETWLERQGTRDRVIVPAVEPRLVHNAFSACGIGRHRVDPNAR